MTINVVNRRIIMTPALASGAGGAGGWTPATLGAALVGWYKADAGVTGTSPVTVWADQSGNGQNMFPLSGWNGYTYNATGLNGKPSLDSAAGSTNMGTVADTVAVGTGSGFAIFALAKFTVSSTSNGPSLYGNGNTSPSNNANSAVLEFYGPSAQIDLLEASNNWAYTTASINTVHRLGFNVDASSNVTMYVDGTGGTPAAITAFTRTTPSKVAGGGIDGSMRELIFVNRTLTSGELTSLDTYLVGRS
jgi:hypothetical protein